MEINLEDFSIKCEDLNEFGDFPVCEAHEVGRDWRFTYLTLFDDETKIRSNRLAKYDRLQKKWFTRKYVNESDISEACPIRVEDQLFLLVVINEKNKTYIELVEAGKFETVCKIELPVEVPYGFHGKWDP